MKKKQKNMFWYTILTLSFVLNISLAFLLLNRPSTTRFFQKEGTSDVSNKNKQQDHSIQMPSKTIKNPLVVLIGCVEYKEPYDNLPDTGVEIDKLKKVFTEVYNYKHITCTYDKNNPATWFLTHKDLDKESKKARDKAIELAEKRAIDGVIFIYSGHGLEGTLLASDGRQYPEARVYEIFSGDQAPQLVDLPKIFMLIKCNGGDWPKPVQKNNQLYHPDGNRFIIRCNTHGYKVDNYAKIADEFSDWATNVPLLHKGLNLVAFFKALSNNVQYSSKHKEILEQQITASHRYFLVPNEPAEK